MQKLSDDHPPRPQRERVFRFHFSELKDLIVEYLTEQKHLTDEDFHKGIDIHMWVHDNDPYHRGEYFLDVRVRGGEDV